MSTFFPRNKLSEIVTTWGQSYDFAQLVCTMQPTQCMRSLLTSAHCEKIVTEHQDVGLQAFMEEMARRTRASGKSFRLQDLSVMFSAHKDPYIACRSFPHTPGCFAFGASFGNRTYASRTRNGIDSHLQLKSIRSLHSKKLLPDTQHRVELAEIPKR